MNNLDVGITCGVFFIHFSVCGGQDNTARPKEPCCVIKKSENTLQNKVIVRIQSRVFRVSHVLLFRPGSSNLIQCDGRYHAQVHGFQSHLFVQGRRKYGFHVPLAVQTHVQHRGTTQPFFQGLQDVSSIAPLNHDELLDVHQK